MAIIREFLGCDLAALQEVVERLVARHAIAGMLDLSACVLVTPGSRAGRRLAELLIIGAEQRGLAYLPPVITTVGRLGELLYSPKRPFASDWTERLAWADAIRSADRATRSRVFRGNELAQLQSDRDWITYGELIRRCYRELAAEGLSFADVAERGAKMSGFPESRRWMAMATVQQDYLRRLDGLKLWDRQTARLEAVRRRECRSGSLIYLIATVDLGRNLRRMLEQVAETSRPRDAIVAWIHAPESWADRFDLFGCLLVERWIDVPIELNDDQMVIADGHAGQAAQAIQAVASRNGEFRAGEIAIGCADASLIPSLQRGLASQGVHGRWGPGRKLTESAPFRLLVGLSEVLQTRDFAAYASFLRHPDTVEWLQRQGVDTWIDQLDDYERAHLPTDFPTRWFGNSAQHDRLAIVGDKLRELLKPLGGTSRSLAEWSRRLEAWLAAIYQSAEWTQGRSGGRVACEGVGAIRQSLIEMREIPSSLSSQASIYDSLRLLLDACHDVTIPESVGEEAIELLGWLELPLDDSKFLVVTGMNEGLVPQANRSDMFLPNSLRGHLRMEDDDFRYCRDAYALSVLAKSHPNLKIFAGNRNATGEPLKPSRLLFATDPASMARRWLRFLQCDPDSQNDIMVPSHATTSDSSDSAQERRFRFEVPPVVKQATPLKSMRTTDFKRYLACPYRFYLSRVLGLKSMSDEVSELDGASFGSLLHEVMNQFGLGRSKDSTDASEIEQELVGLLHDRMRDRFGKGWNPAVRVQLEQMVLRLRQWSTCQARRRSEGWRIQFVEQPTEIVTAIHVDVGEMPISGRIDRIDQHEKTGDYAIWDYKTSDAGEPPEKTHRIRSQWCDLQLPMYRYMAHSMGLENISEVGYILLPKRLEAISFCKADWTEADYVSAEGAAGEIVTKVLQQEFWPPLDPDFDEYASILMSDVPERPRCS